MPAVRPLSFVALPVLLSVSLGALQAGPLALPAPPMPQAGQARDLVEQPKTTPDDRRGAILGTVFDGASGQPLEGVRLTLSGTGVRGGSAVMSDPDGRFAFAGIGAGDVMLRGSKAGYISMTYGQVSPNSGRSGTPIELASGQTIKDLKFSLPKGGVITGVVFDEKNRPSVGTPVRVLRWSMATGERTLSSAGTATTDDRGMYRVYGLAPGEYIVNAVARNESGIAANTAEMMEMVERLEMARAEAGTISFSGGISVGGGSVTIDGDTMEIGQRTDAPTAFEGYAPVYYPGTPSLGAAGTVTLGVSEERASVDFALARVVLARVDGTIVMPAGVPATTVQVRLVDTSERVPGNNTPSARSNREGRFTFSAVPPGQYRMVATANVRATPPTPPRIVDGRMIIETNASENTTRYWAMTDVSVNGAPLTNVGLEMRPGVTATGRLVFEGAAPRPGPNARVRLTIGPTGAMASAMGAATITATVQPDGRFTVPGLVPGAYRVRSLAGASGWSLESAMAGGLDTLDFPFEITPGQPVPELFVTATDKTASLDGAIQDALGRPTADYTVILFPADPRYWLPQARRIRSTRPSTAGKFSFRGLPAGDYRLAAVTDIESGQWYDPAFLQQLAGASVAVSLTGGQTRTQDLRVAGGG